MEISGKQSTKSYGTQRQEINKVIWYVPGEHDALAVDTSSYLPAAAQTTNSCPRSSPRRWCCTAGHLCSPPRPPTLHAACSAPQLTRSVPLQEHSLRVQGPSIGGQRQQDILPRMR